MTWLIPSLVTLCGPEKAECQQLWLSPELTPTAGAAASGPMVTCHKHLREGQPHMCCVCLTDQTGGWTSNSTNLPQGHWHGSTQVLAKATL